MSEEGKPTILSKDTLLPLGLLLSAATVIFGGGVFFNKMNNLQTSVDIKNVIIEDHANRLTKLETLYSSQYQQVVDALVELKNTQKEIQVDIKELKKNS